MDFTPEQEAAIAERIANEVAGLKQSQSQLLKEKKDAAAKLAAYDGFDPEEFKRLKSAADEAEKKRLQGEGDFKALESQLLKKMTDAEQTYGATIDRYRGSISRHLIDATAIAELAKHSDTPELLLPHVKTRMKVFEQDGDFTARVVDDAGNVRIGKGAGAEPMTLGELIEEMKQNKTYAPAFRGSGSSGGGAPKSNAGGGGNPKAIPLGDGAAFMKNIDGIRKGEVAVPVNPT